MNLDIEGKALAGYYKKVETDKNTMIKNSDKQTKSQLQAANRELKKQTQKLRDKQLTRDALTKQVKGRARNYA